MRNAHFQFLSVYYTNLLRKSKDIARYRQDVMRLRRLCAVLLTLSLLIFPAKATPCTGYVALTFDDGPSGRFTRRLLEGLEQRQVKATFLLCGYRMKDDGKTTREIYEAGHEIGLHGYSHDNMGKMDYKTAAKEIADTAALLPEGCRPVFLRPPGGASAQALEKAALDAGLALLSWSVDPRDWAVKDAQAVQTAVLADVRDGDVILLHDMSDSSVDAALGIVDSLLGQGFRFVTVSELAEIRGIAPQPGITYRCFYK